MLLFKVSSRNFQPCHTTSCNSCLLFYYYFNAILILFFYHFNAIIMLFCCHFIEGTWGKVPGSIANISELTTEDCSCKKIEPFNTCKTKSQILGQSPTYFAGPSSQASPY